jgi:mono/diheme cytochrome c family protein
MGGATVKAFLIFSLALAAFATPALAAKPAASRESVAEGRRIAVFVCSACHQVGDKQEFEPLLTQKTPSFQEIADDPKSTAQSLRRFISTTHWDEKTIPMTMPRQMLMGGETDDVVSYILSLRARRPPGR